MPTSTLRASLRGLASTGLGLGVSLAFAIGGDADLAIATYESDSPSRIPVLEVRRRAPSAPDQPVALLVHGFQCNKGMMASLAKDLARGGVDAFAIDLPGHGASPERYSDARAREVAREAVALVLARRGIGLERLALVGHSYGAMVLAPVAASDPRLRANVFLGPGYEGGFAADALRNVLVVTAAHDHDFVLAMSARLVRDATAGRLDAPGAESGDRELGTARAWRTVPGDHVSLLYGPGAARETLSWIADGSHGGASRGETPARATLTNAARACALAFAIAAAFFLVRALGAVLAAPDRPQVRIGARTAFAAASALGAAVTALLLGPPRWLLPLRLHEGEAIGSVFLVLGVVAAGVGLLLRESSLPSVAQLARGLAPALLAAGLVLGTASAVSSSAWYHLSLLSGAPERLGVAVVLAAAFLPFFAFADGTLRALRRGGGLRPHAIAFVAAAAFHAALAGALVVLGGGLGRFAVPVFALGLGAVVVGGLLGAAARNRAVGALFSSTVAGWIVAAGFLRY